MTLNNLYFRSLVCSELLFPWIRDLPDQLVQLGNSNPKTSGVIISSISLAAMHMNTEVLQPTVDAIFSKLNLFIAVHLHKSVGLHQVMQRKHDVTILYICLMRASLHTDKVLHVISYNKHNSRCPFIAH